MSPALTVEASRSSRALRWGLGVVVIGALGGLVAWAFLRDRTGLPGRTDLERPIEPPQRVARNPAGDMVLTLDAETQKRIGLEVEALEAWKLSPEIAGYGRVLDPGSLVTLLEEVTAGEAHVTSARADYERAKALYQSVKGVAQHSVEAAEADLVGRETRARAAAGRLINAWGVGMASLPPADRDALVDRLVKRQAALVRVDLPPGDAIEEPPAGAAIVPLATEGLRMEADRVFDAPTVDERVQGQGFLLYLESPSRVLRPGAVVAAYVRLPGGPDEGILIPRSAIVRLEGMPWAYIQGAPDKFLRREVKLERLLEKGWFTRSGFTAGEHVVVAGAQVLLSEELRYQIRLEND